MSKDILKKIKEHAKKIEDGRINLSSKMKPSEKRKAKKEIARLLTEYNKK